MEDAKYRGQLVLTALFSPELIVLLATRQWIASRGLAKRFEGASSFDHAFLLCLLFLQSTVGPRVMVTLLSWEGSFTKRVEMTPMK